MTNTSNSKKIGLKGHCHEIFDIWFFSWISFPQAPEYTIRAVTDFFENSQRYSQFKVHHRCRWHQILFPLFSAKNLVPLSKDDVYYTPLGFSLLLRLPWGGMCGDMVLQPSFPLIQCRPFQVSDVHEKWKKAALISWSISWQNLASRCHGGGGGDFFPFPQHEGKYCFLFLIHSKVRSFLHGRKTNFFPFSLPWEKRIIPSSKETRQFSSLLCFSCTYSFLFFLIFKGGEAFPHISLYRVHIGLE